jgi:hypothetical protein
MKTIEIKIQGVSPLLQHRFPEEEQASKTKKKSATSNDGMVENSLYRLPDGTIYEPSTHILGALKGAAGRFQIKGRGKATYRNIIGGGAAVIEPDAIPHIFQKWVVDSRPVVNPSTKGRVLRKRPCFNEWGLSFRLIVDEEEMPIETLKEIFDVAGRNVGIGDFRPAKGGPFGRFMITRFDVQ